MAQIYNQVKVATTVNLNLATSIQPGVTTIDGVIVNASDRILVKAQSDKKQNGIYEITALGAWTRVGEFGTSSVQEPGAIVMVTQGDTFADTGWTISSDGFLVVGTSDIEFERITLNIKAVSGDLPSNIVLRSVKGRPLTNLELDNNFKFLGTSLTQKLNIVDFNAQSIVSRINTLTFTQAGLNANLLRGNPPSQTSTGLTIALRDSSGNLAANAFIGNLQGNATTATSATFATLSGNVTGTVAIANGGTGSNTASGARIALGILHKAGDSMTGKLTLAASSTARASLNITQGIAPTDPDNGDVWSDGANIRYQLNDVVQRVAHLDSPAFAGVPTAPTAATAANNTTIATTQFVKNVKSELIDPAIALKANIESPTLTGDPKTPTAVTSNISTSIANTQFVKNYLDERLTAYDKWGTSRKFVQSADPGGAAVDGDFWFKI